jgi:asparagine synthase (glutamine-hydrolysing)
MSAIAGRVNFEGCPVDAAELRQMIDTLAHRGPDGGNIWVEAFVGLGHRMLWTTPESLFESLPLVQGSLVITADARIDNRKDLISVLAIQPGVSEIMTDSQLILAAYQKWGEDCPTQLVGDFAFAIWDQQNQHLFCARDHLGIKPFYYYATAQTLIFASEIKGLRCLPEVPDRLNQVKIADYLLQIYADQAATFYQDIHCLPAAHALTVNADGFRLRQYWQLDPSWELRLSSEAQYAEAYREIFTEAVRCRLRSAFAIGSMLSGGLDSSSIVCTARHLLAHPLKTFSAVFEDVPESDERPFIQAVLDGGGIEPHFVSGDRLALLMNQEVALQAQDEPFDAPNLFLNRAVWQMAQQQGVRVLLDGLMGDNVVSHGFAYLNQLAYAGRWLTLALELRALAQRRQRSFWEPWRRLVWNDGIKPRIPQAMQRTWRQWRGYPESTVTVPSVINREFAHRIGLIDRLQTLEASQSTLGKTARELHYQELASAFVPLSMAVLNRGIAAFGMEARLPFTDRRLMEFCLAIPPEQKLHQGWSRMIVRRSLGNCLPPEIQWRDSKGDLGFNFMHTLTAEGSYLKDLLHRDSAAIGQFVNLPVLHDLCDQFLQTGKQDHNLNVQTLLLATTLAQWLRSEQRINTTPRAQYELEGLLRR